MKKVDSKGRAYRLCLSESCDRDEVAWKKRSEVLKSYQKPRITHRKRDVGARPHQEIDVELIHFQGPSANVSFDSPTPPTLPFFLLVYLPNTRLFAANA